MLPDYRFHDYPVDENGKPMYDDEDDECDPDSVGHYLAWLSGYLKTIPLEPALHQFGLCSSLTRMPADTAMRSLGSDLGIHDAVEAMTSIDPTGLDDEEWQEFESTHKEEAESFKSKLREFEWPYSIEPPIDLGYRVPLAIILHAINDEKERVKLLKLFLDAYWQYTTK